MFEELKDTPNYKGYYGLPNRLGHNGTEVKPGRDGVINTCVTNSDNHASCKPMKKLFYLQFQWFPFYMAGLALLYYLPYIMHQFVNSDLLSFKKAVKQTSAEELAKNYFNPNTNLASRQILRILGNILVKVFYLIANICVFTFTDSLLNNNFIPFGGEWFSWTKMTNTKAYNYIGIRRVIKPGERLLPVFGFCDVLESGKDIKHALVNEYSLLCEISQHVLYHYVLIAIWMLIVIGFVMSIIGLILAIIPYIVRARMFAREEVAAREVYRTLSVREAEYLDMARKKNVPLYGALVRYLHSERHTDPDVPKPNTPFIKDSGF